MTENESMKLGLSAILLTHLQLCPPFFFPRHLGIFYHRYTNIYFQHDKDCSCYSPEIKISSKRSLSKGAHHVGLSAKARLRLQEF